MKKISLYYLSFLGLGALLVCTVLITQVMRYESIQSSRKALGDAHEAVVSLQYNTEKLLTTPNLKKQQQNLLHHTTKLRDRLHSPVLFNLLQPTEIIKLFKLIEARIPLIMDRLNEPDSVIKNVTETSLISYLAKGSGPKKSQESGEVLELVHAINDLLQHEAYLHDDLHSLNQGYLTVSDNDLTVTERWLVWMPVLSVIIVFVFGFLVFFLSRKVDDSIRRSRASLKEAQRIAQVGCWDHDIVNNRLDWSDETYRIFEVDRQSTVPSYELFLGLIHQEDKEMVNSSYMESVRSGKPFDIVHRLQMNDGSIKYIREQGETEFNDRGEAVSSRGVVMDITTQRENEETMRILSTAVEQSPAAIVITDRQGVIEYVNPKMVEHTGYEDQELIGNKTSVLKSGLTPAQTYDQLWQTIGRGRVWNGEFINRRKDDSLLWESAVIAPIFTPDNTISKYIAIKEDITRRKLAEKDREKLELQLNRAKRLESIGLMAGGVAHDLNNILSGVVGYPELILMALPKDSDMRPLVEAIQDSGKRAATVVSDLFSIARGPSSAREVHNLNMVIKDYLNSSQHKKLKILHSEVTCEQEFSATRPHILCSPIQVKKCLVNLIENANEAISGKGVVTITTENQFVDYNFGAKHSMAAGDYVVVKVMDDGQGIAKNDLERIFDPFYTNKVMAKSGSGLGLTIVWKTMADHDGKVLLESSEEGTCFKLYYPVSREMKTETMDYDLLKNYMGNGERILIVDDEPQLLDIAEKILTTFGYDVLTVSSGEEAIDYLREQRADLLVLDMFMDPGLNGRQTYDKIVKICPGQKVVIASGSSESDDVKGVMKQGAGGFIQKPYSMVEIGRAVQEVLQG
ncbi:MAG: PAS domain-containing protein [Thermodesulfobacteriota bacterium]